MGAYSDFRLLSKSVIKLHRKWQGGVRIDKPLISVSFSGGRTSAYMARRLKDHECLIRLHFIFANTGLEHEKTLDFVHQCDQAWNLNLTWIETVVNPEKGKGSTYKVVDYESASRNGEPFEDVCAVYGLSNPTFKPCNREMKTVPMDKYRRDHFGKDCLIAIGIRADEWDRMVPNWEERRIVYPLVEMGVTKSEVRHWWREQPFDLEIPEHMGNCVTCWKKTDRKLYTIAKHEPERFDFMRRMEKEHGCSGEPNYDKETGEIIPRRWFRHYRTVDDIIASSKKPFIEFVDQMPAHQLDMFGLDQHSGCEESCEAFGADFE